MSDSLTATKVETNQCPSHQSILLTQGPIHEIFMKKYWELTKPWKWLLFSFLVFGFWLLGCSKNFFFGFSVWKKPRRFIWGSIYSCTMDGFFRILKKAVSELICTRLYAKSKSKQPKNNNNKDFIQKLISFFSGKPSAFDLFEKWHFLFKQTKSAVFPTGISIRILN